MSPIAYDSRPRSVYFTLGPQPGTYNRWTVTGFAPPYQVAKTNPEALRNFPFYAVFDKQTKSAPDTEGALITLFTMELLPDGTPVPLTDPAFVPVEVGVTSRETWVENIGSSKAVLSPIHPHHLPAGWVVFDRETQMPLYNTPDRTDAEMFASRPFIRLIVFGQPVWYGPDLPSAKKDDVMGVLSLLIKTSQPFMTNEDYSEADTIYAGKSYYPNKVQWFFDTHRAVTFMVYLSRRVLHEASKDPNLPPDALDRLAIIEEILATVDAWTRP